MPPAPASNSTALTVSDSFLGVRITEVPTSGIGADSTPRQNRVKMAAKSARPARSGTRYSAAGERRDGFARCLQQCIARG